MNQKRFTVEQIVGVLKRAKVGVPVAELMTLPHKPRRKRRAAMPRRERFRPKSPNQVWGLDFGRPVSRRARFRALTCWDVFTRESLAIEVGQRLQGEDLVGALNQIRQKKGTPKLLFCDSESEFTDLWAYHNDVQIDFSRPGKPTDNAHVGSFNGTCEPSVWTYISSRH